MKVRDEVGLVFCGTGNGAAVVHDRDRVRGIFADREVERVPPFHINGRSTGETVSRIKNAGEPSELSWLRLKMLLLLAGQVQNRLGRAELDHGAVVGPTASDSVNVAERIAIELQG